MSIKYHRGLIPTLPALINLYDSVGWINYTKNLVVLKNAFEHSLGVFTAWDGAQLVGVARVVGDGASILYFQDCLVLPDYQHQHIGSTLIKMVLQDYATIYQIVLMTDNQPASIQFYESCGFALSEKINCTAMVYKKD